MTEKEVINRIIPFFKNSKGHLNNFFESDSEVLEFGNQKLLFSTDEFSSEDLFRDNNPYDLGRNLAIATLSDVLASGGKPVYYAHSMVVQNDWSIDYIEKFTKGIASILNENDITFIGGDFGKSNEWKYTGIALGTADKSISRKGACVCDYIYMTGEAGAGNIDAALSLYSKNKLAESLLKNIKTEFQYRIKESELINKFATSCIDTSDGLFNALNTISELNNTGFEVENIPYSKNGKMISKLINKPIELLFVGECGEYELLFTVPSEKKDEFEREVQIKKLEIKLLGRITKETKILKTSAGNIDFKNFSISARDFKSTKDYLRKIEEFLK